MNPSFAALVLALAAALAAPAPLPARTWTQASTGKTLDGEFVRVDGEDVVIRMANGQERHLPLAMLDDADKAFAAEAAAKMTEAEPETAAADNAPGEVTLLGLHLCCSGCERRVKELAEREDDELDISIASGEVKIKAEDDRAAQAAVDRIVIGGFYGKTNSDKIVFYPQVGTNTKADAVEVSNVHICCGKCVSAFEDALASVKGVEGMEIEKGETKFLITGTGIEGKEVIAALNAAGLNGKARKAPEAAEED